MDEDAPEQLNPRTRRVRELMLTTAVGILTERGAHEVTAVRVAELADVARTTVYRQWPDQRSLLLATIHELTAPHHPTTRSGPLDKDLRLALEQLRTRLTEREVRAVFGALAGYAAQDETFSDAQRLFVCQLTDPVRQVFESAIERGEIDSSTDCTLEANLLAGPVLHCHLALYDEITDSFIDELVRRWRANQT